MTSVALRRLGDPIGRSAQTEAILEAIRECAEGRKRAVVLLGPSGIGKTTILQWAFHQAREAGFACALSRAPVSGPLPRLFPLGELFDALAETQSGSETIEPFANLIRALHERNPTEEGSVGAPQIARAIQEAAPKPVALFLDDYQWMPEQAVSTLLAAIRITERPLLLITTVRTPLEADGPSIPGSTGDLSVEQHHVPDLDEATAGSLAESVLGERLLPSAQRLLWQRTAGNPLFILEMLRAWRASGAIIPASGGYLTLDERLAHAGSESIEGMIAGRLRGLDENSLGVARVLAVLGRSAHFKELEKLAGIEGDGLTESLARLEEEALISVDERSPHRHRLAHPLFQTAILRELRSARLGQLHSRVYQMLREDGSNVAAASAAELAHHAINADPPPSDLEEILADAGAEAESAGSFAEAADWYGRMAELRRHDRPRLVRALSRRADALEHINAIQSIAVYSEALDMANGDAERAQLLLGRARAFRAARRFDDALGDLSEVLTITDRDEQIAIRHQIAVIQGLIGDIDRAEALLRELIESSAGTPMHAKVIGSLSDVAASKGKIAEAMALNEAAQAETNDPAYRALLRGNLAWDLLAVGRWDEADEVLEEEIERARMNGNLRRLLFMLSSATMLAAWRGDFDNAFDLGEEGMRIAERNALPVIVSSAALATALLEQERPSDVTGFLADLPGLAEATPEKWDLTHPFLVGGEAHLITGDSIRAAAYCDAAARYLQGNAYWAPSVDRLKAQIALDAGDADGALRALHPWLDAPGPMRFEHARLTDVAARALASAGKQSEGLQRADEAMRLYSGLGAEPRAGLLAKWIASQTVRRRGRPRTTAIGDLTEREREVLSFVTEGLTNREIATRLTISHATVKKHVENVKAKAGVSRRTELVRVAAAFLIRPSDSK